MQILLPAIIGNNAQDLGHFFVISVNKEKHRFELLDSMESDNDTLEYFVDVTSKLKKIWKAANKRLQEKDPNAHLIPSSIDHFERKILKVPQQGNT